MRAVVWYTGKEFLRKKILYVIAFIAIVLLLGAVIAGQLALSEQTKIIQDISWSVIEISGLVITLFFGSSLLATEIQQGTIFLLLSKHIKRSSLLVGKYLGFAWILFLLWLMLSIAFFIVTTAYHIPFTIISVYVLIGIFLSRLLTLAIVLFFTTFVSPFIALFVSLLVYLLGHMMSFVVYYMTEVKSGVFSPLFMRIVKGLYLVRPNYTLLSLQEFTTMPDIYTIAPEQLLSGAVMALVYIVLLLTLGSLIFRKKEI